MPSQGQAILSNRRERHRQRQYNVQQRDRQNHDRHVPENEQNQMENPVQQLHVLHNELQQNDQPAQQPMQEDIQNPVIQPEEENNQNAEPALQPAQHYPAPHVLGKMDYICEHCLALYFPEERNSTHKYNKCCFAGKVSLPRAEPPSHAIIELYEGLSPYSIHLKQNIRKYNSVLAMAS